MSHSLSLLGILAVLGAGLVAGAINTIVGSGSLVTFPVLVGLGYSPLVANVSNTIGLVGGSLSGVHGYRAELKGQRERAISLGIWSIAGAITGALLLLAFPSSFEAVVPWLVLLAVALVVAQPFLAKRQASRLRHHNERKVWLRIAVGLIGVYGGYFGAAQGVLLIGVLGLGLPDNLQRINGLKIVLAGFVNIVAAVIFVFAAPIAWLPAVLLVAASTVGAQIGAKIGRRLSPTILRGIIIVAGLAVAIKLLV